MKKSFIMGWIQVAIWFIAWMIFGFVNAAGASVYRSGIAAAQEVELSAVLEVTGYVGIILVIVYWITPKIIAKIGAKNLLVITAFMGAAFAYFTPMFKSAILLGIGFAIIEMLGCVYCTVTTMVLVSKWFPRKKGVIMGIITSAGLFSSLVILPLFNKISMASGINGAMTFLAIFTAAFAVLALLLLKETPAAAGLLPDNMPLDEGQVEALGNNDKIWDMKTIVKKKKFWFVSLGWSLELLGVIGFISIAVPYMIMHGVEQPMAIKAMGICGIIQFLTSNISGIIDQKIGPAKTAIAVFILQIAGFIIAGTFAGDSAFIPMLAIWLIMGVFGATNNLDSSQILSIFGPKNFSVAFNMFVLISSVTKPIGTIIAGRSLAATGDYKVAALIYAGFALVGFVLMLMGGDKKITSSTDK